MKVLDPGHKYELDHLDGKEKEVLTFVKREGSGYPGNVGHYEGTNLQEVLRALIDRVKYLDNQVPDHRNESILNSLRMCIWWLECRAAERHGRRQPYFTKEVEYSKVCGRCGHMGCNGQCKEHKA